MRSYFQNKHIFVVIIATLVIAIKYTFSKQQLLDKVKLFQAVEDPNDYLECVDANDAEYRFSYNNIDKATDYLLENGYVVIKNVLDQSEVEYGKSLFWEFVESESIGWNRNDFKTWYVIKVGGELDNGLLWGKGIGQSKFQWFGRKHPKVLNIFANLWNHKSFPKDNKHNSKPIDATTDLLTSFDGISFFTPWYLMEDDDIYKTNAGWYHIDVNVAKKPGIQTIQSYLTYYDQNEATGSTVLIPKTHLKVSKELKVSRSMGDFVMINKNNPLLDSKRNKKILVNTKAGDMLLWDSRTVHCSSPALLPLDEMKRVHSNNNNVLESVEPLRLVSMICMVPKYRLNGEKYILKERVNAYVDQCTLCHWPTEYCVLWCPIATEIAKNDIDDTDDLTKSLIGYI